MTPPQGGNGGGTSGGGPVLPVAGNPAHSNARRLPQRGYYVGPWGWVAAQTAGTGVAAGADLDRRGETRDRCRAWASIAGSSARTRTEASDRKSTRLNSSHVRSSYAVFCLK